MTSHDSPRPEVYYPSTDDNGTGEPEWHLWARTTLFLHLCRRFSGVRDVVLMTRTPWYYDERKPRDRVVPDIMVTKGIAPQTPPGRTSFKSWEEHTTPCFVLELTTDETYRNDAGVRFGLYERLGVAEYFIFDGLRELPGKPLDGYRLSGGRYHSIPHDSESGLVSTELLLRFDPLGSTLLVRDAATGHLVLDPTAARVQLDIVERSRQTRDHIRDP